jgi:hypothetical protein
MAAKKSFHKTFLIVLMVLTPLWWLTMTEDGQQRADSVLLRLLGDKPIDLKIEALDGGLTEAELKQVYPDLPWQCQDANTNFGNRVCSSKIGTYNGLPSRLISFYFANNRLRVFKLNYRENYHVQLGSQLIDQLGQPAVPVATRGEAPPPENILQWQTPFATVIIKEDLTKGEEAALLWLAKADQG